MVSPLSVQIDVVWLFRTNLIGSIQWNCLGNGYANAWRSIACSMALWWVFKYTLSLSEFRNLFSLNSNPKPDQGWLYFKVWSKKTLLGGYPNNVKGWKSKFFFVTGDEWEFSKDATREDKHCNYPPRLYGDEPKVFVSSGSMASGTAGEEHPGGGAMSLSGDAGESCPSNEHVRQQSPSRDDSVECLGSIRTELRKILPHIPDLPLLRWLGGKRVVLQLSKRIIFKKLGENLEKSKNESSSRTLAPVKGVVIGEKHARESLASSPSKMGKVDDSSKGKGVDRELEGKKKVTSSSNAPTTPATALSRTGEGTSANLGTVLGPTASILGSPSIAEKLLREVIPSTDKEKALVLGSSLAVRSREAGEHASLQEGRVASMESEVARLQKLSADLEQQLAEARVCEQQTNNELAKIKSDRDSFADKFERLGVLVVELREALNKAKESAVEEFKSSLEFLVAVEILLLSTSAKGFEFCKVQLCRHHPVLD
ncbi:hypothetical protein Acr_00g0008710 [Actinidia rufa]|uniref:Uncharacterized protein n=1 Tax=Actinidia rufa TaxID=165716 RepID=A0A7J0D8Q9_9ERIC|nr:hypothetical protein Acr_00g0008710 [Actinidia rufa]